MTVSGSPGGNNAQNCGNTQKHKLMVYQTLQRHGKKILNMQLGLWDSHGLVRFTGAKPTLSVSIISVKVSVPSRLEKVLQHGYNNKRTLKVLEQSSVNESVLAVQ